MADPVSSSQAALAPRPYRFGAAVLRVALEQPFLSVFLLWAALMLPFAGARALYYEEGRYALAALGGVEYVLPGRQAVIPLAARHGQLARDVTLTAAQRPSNFVVRAVARADNHIVLGLQAVGQGVSELSSAFSLAIEMGARLEDIAGTIHAHPTRSEGLQEAALKALGHALHI